MTINIKTILQEKFEPTEEETIKRKIRAYLVNSFIYYILNDSIMDDHDFDLLCKYLLDNFDKIKKGNYPYKELIKRSALSAGSGFSINRKKYPQEIVNKAYQLLKINPDGKIKDRIEKD